jgi:hypothetical protein
MSTVGKSRGGRTLRRVVLGLTALTVPSVCPSRAEDCKYFSALPDDCARASLRKFEGLRDYRYEEIELFAKDPLKKVLYVTVYDTTGLNGGMIRETQRQRRLRKIWIRRRSPNNIRRSRRGSILPTTGQLTGSPINVGTVRSF